MLTRRLCQRCCGVSIVSITTIRAVRRRAARVAVDGSVYDSSPASDSSSQSSSFSPSSSSLSLTSPSPHPLIPSTTPQFPKAVYGLTEEKLRELAATMPPVLASRENVVELPPPPVKEVKKSPLVTEENQERVLAHLYTPLWQLPYNEQLQVKENKAGMCLRNLKKRIFNVYGLPLPEQLPRLPCPLHPILPAPVEREYRSEDTFTVWRGLDGNPKTVGLLTGDTKVERTVCLPPSSLITVRDKHKLFCQAFQDYIRHSPHPSFLDYHSSRGVWRSVTVRTTDCGDTLASVLIFPHLLDEDGVAAIENELREHFTTGPGAAVGLTALYLQVSETTHRCRYKAPYKQVFGPSHLEETYAGVSYRVLPDTALPVNPSAQDVLVSSVLQATGISSHTNLLYVGAASGHMCLPLARSVQRAVCVEGSQSAVDDALTNITRNGLHNATFFQGAPEKVLPSILPDLKSSENVVAIVDCGDKALHPQVVIHLRRTRSISQLLMLTTKPDGFVLANCASFANMLGRNKLSQHPPLLPVLAFAVDVAPQTSQFAMGVLLSRDEYTDVSPHRTST